MSREKKKRKPKFAKIKRCSAPVEESNRNKFKYHYSIGYVLPFEVQKNIFKMVTKKKKD